MSTAIVENSNNQQIDGQVDVHKSIAPSVEDDEALARRLQAEWNADDAVASGNATTFTPSALNTADPGLTQRRLREQQPTPGNTTTTTTTVTTTNAKVATVSNAWGYDVEQSHCTSCHDEFTPFNRRHHCRLCGKIFCHACSDQRALIPPSSIVLTPSRGGKKAQPPPPSQNHPLSFTPDPDPDRMLTYIDEDKQLLYGKGLEER